MDLVDRNLIGSLVDAHGNVHYEDIKNLPSEIEITRCRDCINFYNNHLCLHWSKHGTIEVRPDDFCSYGEKK